MIPLTLLSFVPALFGAMFQSANSPTVSRVIIQQQLIIGVPVRPHVSRPIEWQEKHGPKCVPANGIAGALLSGESSIDFIMVDRQRVRAKLDGDCPALDYYTRFYLQPEDGMICAGRDTVRSRMGSVCRIDKFKLLKPKVRD